MASELNVVLTYIVCLSLVSNVLSDTDQCIQKGPCKCEFANGTGIDLTPSSSASTFYEANTFEKNVTTYKMSVYYFHPCSNIKPPVTFPNVVGNVSLYRLVETLDKVDNKSTYSNTTNNDFLGVSDNIMFGQDGGSIVYLSNKPSNTTILLICAQTNDTLSIRSLDEPNNLVLAFYSRNACLKQIEDFSHRSFGSTLLIIFFSCVIFYLVLGILTKKFLMGATGIEVIPNLSFWADLPGLCKDGWIFIKNGFKVLPRDRPSTSHDPNSYDSI